MNVWFAPPAPWVATGPSREPISPAGNRPAADGPAAGEVFTLTRLTHGRLLRAETRQDEEPWLLCPKTVAKLLGISRSKVYEMLRDGTLDSVTIGRSRRIRREDLQRWLIDLAVQQR